MKEVADFKVFTKGAGSGELKVTVKGPSECQGPGLEAWGRQGWRWWAWGSREECGQWLLFPESFESQYHMPLERLQREPDLRHWETLSTRAPLCLSFPVCQLGMVLSAVDATVGCDAQG